MAQFFDLVILLMNLIFCSKIRPITTNRVASTSVDFRFAVDGFECLKRMLDNFHPNQIACYDSVDVKVAPKY
jgi:hypothetical protein